MQTQKIGKRYALQWGYRQYKETLQKKYKQQNYPIFKQIQHNLLPENFQNLQQESRCLGCIQELEKAESLNLSQAQRSFTLMIDHIGMRGGQNSSFDSKYSELIEQSLCALLNNSRGYLLVGVSPNKGTVCGVQINDKKRSSFVQNVRKVLSKFIMPKEELEPLLRDYEEFDKVFQIRFIPVVERQSSNDETDLYVIRIRADTTQIIRPGKVFYVKKQENEPHSYTMIRGNIEPISSEKLMHFVEIKFDDSSKKIRKNNTLYHHIRNIKCQKENQFNIDEHQSQDNHRQDNQCSEANNIYSSEMQQFQKNSQNKSKRYKNESLVVLKSLHLKYLLQYKQQLNQKKVKFSLHELKDENWFDPYGKLIYLMLHQAKHRLMGDILCQMEQKLNIKTSIFISGVKQSIWMHYNQNNQYQKNQIWNFKEIFHQKFSSDLLYGSKREFDKALKCERVKLFLRFEGAQERIFAFAFFQKHGQKVKFIKQTNIEWQRSSKRNDI